MFCKFYFINEISTSRIRDFLICRDRILRNEKFSTFSFILDMYPRENIINEGFAGRGRERRR